MPNHYITLRFVVTPTLFARYRRAEIFYGKHAKEMYIKSLQLVSFQNRRCSFCYVTLVEIRKLLLKYIATISKKKNRYHSSVLIRQILEDVNDSDEIEEKWTHRTRIFRLSKNFLIRGWIKIIKCVSGRVSIERLAGTRTTH